MLRGFLFYLFHPFAYVNLTFTYILEGLSIINAVGKYDASRAFIISLCDGSKSLLPSRVPELEANSFVPNCDSFDLEVNTDCSHVVAIKIFIAESQNQVSFSYPTVSDHDDFEHIIVCLFC